MISVPRRKPLSDRGRDCSARRTGVVQLYPTRKWEAAEALLRRAERAGSPVIVVTVDGPAPVNWETLVRLRRTDTPVRRVPRQNFSGLCRTQTEFRWH